MLEFKGVEESEFIEYKGRPLVRQGNEIFYGDLTDNYYVCMMIMTEKDAEKGEGTVPDAVVVQLLPKDSKIPEKQIIAKGFADAFETADAWLDRRNK